MNTLTFFSIYFQQIIVAICFIGNLSRMFKSFNINRTINLTVLLIHCFTVVVFFCINTFTVLNSFRITVFIQFIINFVYAIFWSSSLSLSNHNILYDIFGVCLVVVVVANFMDFLWSHIHIYVYIFAYKR